MIAAVNGVAVGGGHVLHVLCDVSIAGDAEATRGDGAATSTAAPPAASSVAVPRLVTTIVAKVVRDRAMRRIDAADHDGSGSAPRPHSAGRS